MSLRLRLCVAAAISAALLLWCGSVFAADEADPTPYDSIRTLRRLQEQAAHGNAASHAAQPALMAAMATRFIAADPVVWRDPRNARAAIIYLFSGGKPAVIRAILSRSTMPRETDRLLKGALAYAEGQDQIARDLLDPIDPRSIPAVVGGQLALVEATLVAQNDAKKAAHFLDLARLLVPGSLVEEAALRRQITLETDPDSLGKFVFLSRQYLHRYQSSIYALNFKQHFAAEAMRLGALGDVALIARLDPVIVEFPPDEQRALYLAIAKAAIVKGQTVSARFAAERAAASAADSTRDGARAQLYIDAAAIVSNDVVKGISALEAADRTRLSPDDADLRDAALVIAHSVEAPVPEPTDGVAASAGTTEPDMSGMLDQARKALAAGNRLLDSTK